MNCRSLPSMYVALIFTCTTMSLQANEPQLLMWNQMIPEGDLQPLPILPGIEPGPALNTADDSFADLGYGIRPVQELDSKFVKLPGYVVPLESDEGGLLDEFLFVPYEGACIHVPPPPPNQIVYIRLEKPFEFKKLWTPYWLIGKLRTTPYVGDVAEAVYQMNSAQVERYEHNTLR